MNKREAGRLGGQTLAANMSDLYFERIGRMGGRRTKRNELLAFANSLAETEPERAAIWYERAETYNDPASGNLIMTSLWTKENCESRKPRKHPQTDMAKLRKWERQQKAA